MPKANWPLLARFRVGAPLVFYLVFYLYSQRHSGAAVRLYALLRDMNIGGVAGSSHSPYRPQTLDPRAGLLTA